MVNGIVKVERHEIMTREGRLQELKEAFFSGDFEYLEKAFVEAQDLAPKSRETYRRGIRKLFRFLEAEGMPLKETGRDTLLSFKESLKGLKATTQAGYLIISRRFFTWLESERIFPNVAANIRTPSTPKDFLRDALSVSQARELLESIERETLSGKRDFALINLLVRTGLRTIEIERANLEDIRNGVHGETRLSIQGKGRESKDAFVVLTAETLKPLRAYLQARGGNLKPGSPLFAGIGNRNQEGRLSTRSISRIVKDRMKAAGINSTRITAHSLRHSAITFSLLGGASIQEAKEFARHSNINTTLLYAHNVDRIGNAPERKIDALLAGKGVNG